MTRPDDPIEPVYSHTVTEGLGGTWCGDIPEAVQKIAMATAKEGLCATMQQPWCTNVLAIQIARAILIARSEQREEDAMTIKAFAKSHSGCSIDYAADEIAAAIRNGGCE